MMTDLPKPCGPTQQLLLGTEAATQAAAARLSSALTAGVVIHLSGEPGAGKTTFCRSLIRSLGYNGRVKSPTFTLVEPYNLTRFPLYHFDFYRFSSGEELRDAGFEEQLDAQCVALVEWPERAAANLPAPDLLLRLEWLAESERQLLLTAFTDKGQVCLKAIYNDADYCAPDSPVR